MRIKTSAVGVAYTRAAEFRIAYHVNEHWAIGAGIENPNQYIGTYIALPAQFTAIGTQFDNNANAGSGEPDAGNYRQNHIRHRFCRADTFMPNLRDFSPARTLRRCRLDLSSFNSHKAFGGGGQVAMNYELVPNKLVVLANAFWSDGGAHYLVGTGPELVVRPNAAGTDITLSMVHAGAGLCRPRVES